MAPGELPSEVRRFLQAQIRSIEQLEILLLLREGADSWWSIPDVNQVVRSSERSVAETLEVLVRQGIVRRSDSPPGTFQFSPSTPGMAQIISDLAHLYAERRVRVVEAIYAERPSEVDEFAKAFRLRKDPNG